MKWNGRERTGKGQNRWEDMEQSRKKWKGSSWGICESFPDVSAWDKYNAMNLSGRFHYGPVGLTFPASSGLKCILSPASSISFPRLSKLTAALSSHSNFSNYSPSTKRIHANILKQ